jgi:hypothetical protein
MSEAHLIEAVARRFKVLPKKERVKSIREFASQSEADKRFIRRYFPDLFKEAFRSSATVPRPKSPRQRQRHAAPR